MEVLSGHIRQNRNITGLSIGKHGNKNIKIVQYADDATLFVRNSYELKEAIQSFELFGKVAGTKLNISKCEGLWLGSSKNRQQNCKLYNMRWPTDPIRYLGIYIGHDVEACYKLNFDMKLLQMYEILEQAQKRILTLFGKVCIIKSVALSKIIYVATCVTIPDNVIKEIDKRIFNFLWSKRDRIKRKSVINSLECGGLSMVDTRSQVSAVKASWATRIANASEDHLWSYLSKLYLSKFGENYLILKTTVTETTAFPLLDTIPKFYKGVIFSYNNSKALDYNDFCHNLQAQPIRGNKFIKFQNRYLCFQSCVRAGIVEIGKLKLNNGRLDVNHLINLV